MFNNRLPLKVWLPVLVIAAGVVGYYAWTESLGEPNLESGITNYGQGLDNFASSGVDLSAEALAEVEGWQTYRSGGLPFDFADGFEIKYPPNWEVAKLGAFLATFQISEPHETVDIMDKGNIQISIEQNKTAKTLEELRIERKDASGIFSGFYSQDRKIIIDGTPAYQSRLSRLDVPKAIVANEPGWDGLQKETVMLRDGNVYRIFNHGFVSDEGVERIEKIYDQILSSFKFVRTRGIPELPDITPLSWYEVKPVESWSDEGTVSILSDQSFPKQLKSAFLPGRGWEAYGDNLKESDLSVMTKFLDHFDYESFYRLDSSWQARIPVAESFLDAPSADWPAGSLWGYLHLQNETLKLVGLSYTKFYKGPRISKENEPYEGSCPCSLKLRVFYSDPIYIGDVFKLAK